VITLESLVKKAGNLERKERTRENRQSKTKEPKRSRIPLKRMLNQILLKLSRLKLLSKMLEKQSKRRRKLLPLMMRLNS
jgi:hypothetical protein